MEKNGCLERMDDAECEGIRISAFALSYEQTQNTYISYFPIITPHAGVPGKMPLMADIWNLYKQCNRIHFNLKSFTQVSLLLEVEQLASLGRNLAVLIKILKIIPTMFLCIPF